MLLYNTNNNYYYKYHNTTSVRVWLCGSTNFTDSHCGNYYSV